MSSGGGAYAAAGRGVVWEPESEDPDAIEEQYRDWCAEQEMARREERFLSGLWSEVLGPLSAEGEGA